MGMSRRAFLGATAGAGMAFALGGLAGCGETTGVLLRSKRKLPEPFTSELRLPNVLSPSVRDGTAYYDVTLRPADVEILPGVRTRIWGYDGTFPGPTIESTRGRTDVIRESNKLPVPTVRHLHGGHTPPDSDGYPTDLLIPADAPHPRHLHPGRIAHGTREYRYPHDQRAATLWYHDHRMDFTGPQVWRGLAGFHLIRDDEERALPLPAGDKEIPLMICDRSFGGDGELLYPSVDPSLLGEPGVDQKFHAGVLGDTILVNGVPWPTHDVANTRYRLRFLNASNARNYLLELDPAPADGPSFIQVGSDGGLLDKPREHKQLAIAQGERFDVIVDFGKYPVGTKIVLRNKNEDGDLGSVMRFVVARRERDESSVPARLSTIEPLRGSDAVRERDFDFARGPDRGGMHTWTINDSLFSVDSIAADPKLGDVEVWKLHTNAHHPVHLHLVQFQVLNRNGDGPGRWDSGWKDTVNMASGDHVEIVMKWTGYRGKYVFHCHNLEHEDMAMMANIQVD